MGRLTKTLFEGSDISNSALTERELAIAVTSPSALDAFGGPDYSDPVAREIGLDVYDEMYSTDAQIRACHHMKVMGRLMTGWEFLSAGGDAKHRDFVEYAFENMDGGIHGFLRDLMDALRYGFSVSEIVWKRYETGPWKGHLGLKAIKPKPPSSFELRVDPKGNLRKRGVIQTSANGKELKYPSDKFIIFPYQKEPQGYYGRSDFQPVYRNYFIKKALEKWWAAYLEKFAAPTAVGKYPPGASQTEKKEVLDFLRKMQGNSAAVIPEKWELELLETSPGGSENFLKSIAYQNKMIARGILVPDLIQDQGDRSGSYSLGQVHANNFLWVLQGIGLELEMVVKEQLIRRLLDVNFSSVDSYPEFRFMEFAPDDQKAVADMFLSLVNGNIMSPDEEVIRRRLNLPARGDEGTVDNGLIAEQDLAPQPSNKTSPPSSPPFSKDDVVPEDKDLPDKVYSANDLIAENYRIAKEQFFSQLERKESLNEIKIRQIGRYRELLMALFAEEICRGALSVLVAAEDEDLQALPEGGEPTEERYADLKEVYADLWPVIAPVLPKAEEMAYDLAGKMSQMIRDASLGAKIALAEREDHPPVASAVAARLYSTSWEEDAGQNVTRISRVARSLGERTMRGWIKE